MSGPAHYQPLSRIDSPADLRRLSLAKLPLLAQELRDHLVGSVSSCGGHFAAGLGAIELTIALHYTFNTPEDRLVWDLGHQGYPHKIVTGRRDRIGTIRRRQGLTPFLTREESLYEALNYAGSLDVDLLVVLNDNTMSISPDVGATGGSSALPRPCARALPW